ncbi:MAG TPA: methyltransferase [Patescibacteria group bacterium]|nr:methyltransferase [Gammaproteobacteria bacterium]HWA51450.1 methyltransferase [Patescibacteria group bacterium]
MLQYIYGYEITQCLYVVAKLDIADYLLESSKEIEQLAELCSASPCALYRVMRCLASLGIFVENENKEFSLNDLALPLTSTANNSAKNFIILCGESLYNAAANLLHSVKTGQVGFYHSTKMDYWEYLNLNPEKAKIFNDAMETGSRFTIDVILSVYDFSLFNYIVDIGGGKGHFIGSILKKYPSAKGISFDLAHVTIPANEYINSLELNNRCEIISGSFFDFIPAGGDLYLLKVILHDWDDDNAKAILKNCRKAVTKRSKILIIEKLIDNGNNLQSIFLGDINMLVTHGGKERSLSDFELLLKESNFHINSVLRTSTAFSIIEAIPI